MINKKNSTSNENEFKDLNDITYDIIGCAYKVHSELGPGLLESAYETCLSFELKQKGYNIYCQYPVPVIYQGIKMEAGYRIDILVEDKIVVELKSVDALAPIHKAQLLTYLKLANKQLGLLINFNVVDLKEGINRMVL